MVPRQLAGLREQRGVALRNVTRILCYLTYKQPSSDNYLHWANNSMNVTNLPLILVLDFGSYNWAYNVLRSQMKTGFS